MPSPNRFEDFRSLIATNALAPASNNLFEIQIPPPAILDRSAAVDEAWQTINYFATSVTVPSRAMTTSEVNNFGMIRRFATGQTASEITISFMVTKDQRHRMFFENWINAAASDSDNTVAFYDQYVTDMSVIKWEHGANFRVTKDDSQDKSKSKAALNPSQSTAVWKLYGAFPTNISTISFDNEQLNLVQMDVQFFFERYRFDQVSRATLKAKPFKQQAVFTLDEIETKVAGSGNPDVQRFTI